MIDLSSRITSVVSRPAKPTEESVTKFNPPCRPSQDLTANNSSFGGDYQAARAFEKQLMQSLEHEQHRKS